MADTPEVPAEVYEAAARAIHHVDFRNGWCDGGVTPAQQVEAEAAVDAVWPLAYTAGRDSHLTEWARNLTAGIDDEEMLRARSRKLARQLVEAEIRAEVAAEIRAQAEQIVGRARALAGMPAAGDDHPWMLGMHFAARVAEGHADG